MTTQEATPERPTVTLAAVQVLGWPEFPPGVALAPEIDLRAEDPAETGERFKTGNGFSTRQCVAARQDGLRCRTVALTGHVLCVFHTGRADSRAAAHALAAKRRSLKQSAEEVLAMRRLGTRALVAETLVEKAAEVRGAVAFLANTAADEKASQADRMKAATALIPWLNQALGNPTERVEHRLPSSVEDVEGLATSQLEALVAQGRRERLQAVAEPPSIEQATGTSPE